MRIESSKKSAGRNQSRAVVRWPSGSEYSTSLRLTIPSIRRPAPRLLHTGMRVRPSRRHKSRISSKVAEAVMVWTESNGLATRESVRFWADGC